jgi:hypothetical protein
MVLEVEVGIVHAGKVRIDIELAVGDEFSELGGVAVVFKNFDAVEPVLGVCSVDEDTGGVPVAASWMNGFGVVGCAGGGDEVVEGGGSAIAIFAALGVLVHGVVKDLVLVADRGAGTFSEIEVDGVEDAAVGSGGGAEVDGELVVCEFAGGDDVTCVAAFLSCGEGSARGGKTAPQLFILPHSRSKPSYWPRNSKSLSLALKRCRLLTIRR